MHEIEDENIVFRAGDIGDKFYIIAHGLVKVESSSILESTMSYLGVQDATRKRRKISKRSGEWTGSILITVKDLGLFVTVSQKKMGQGQDDNI